MSPSPQERRARAGGRAALAALVLGLLAGAGARQEAKTPVLHVAVSVPPHAWLVEAIGGDRVAVEVLIPPGASPETYEPSPRQMIALADADLYVAVGHPAFGFERRHLETVRRTHPDLPVVAIADVLDLGVEGGIRRVDPHLWLSPSATRVAASTIAATLTRLDPQGAESYGRGLAATLTEIDRVDQEVSRSFAGLAGSRFLVYHPAWSWLAADYGLQQIAIERGGQEPSPRALREILEQARRSGLHVVFVQPGFSDRAARVVAREIDGRVQRIDPLARDWAQNLVAAARALSTSVAPPES